MSKQSNSFWAPLWQGLLNFLKEYFTTKKILSLLREKVINLAVRKLTRFVFGQAWLVAFVTKELWDEVVEPIIKDALIEIKYTRYKVKGKVTAEKIIEARQYENMDEYHSTVDDLFGRRL